MGRPNVHIDWRVNRDLEELSSTEDALKKELIPDGNPVNGKSDYGGSQWIVRINQEDVPESAIAYVTGKKFSRAGCQRFMPVQFYKEPNK